MLDATAVFLLAQVSDHGALADTARIAAGLMLAWLVHHSWAHRLPAVELRFAVGTLACCAAMMVSMSPVLPMLGLACSAGVSRWRHVRRVRAGPG